MNYKKALIPLAVISAMATACAAESTSVVKISKASKISVIKSSETVEKSTPISAVAQVAGTASYKNAQTAEDIKSQLKSMQKTSSKLANPSKQRSVQAKSSAKATHLYLYDSAVFLQTDEDGDGYYSEIRVDFDVDSSYSAYYDVFAELYIRPIGTSDWTHYYTTDVFDIYGASGSDEYSVTTTLNTGYPSDYYEIAIDLFEYGYSDVVDSLEAYDDPDLGNLPLEDKTNEFNNTNTGVTVETVKTEIFTDNDGDGYYSDFKISFDIDTDSGSRDVVTKLYQRLGSGNWQYETQTDVYTITGSEVDTIAIEGEWQSGYATGYYDFKLEVVDANSNELLYETSNEFSPLLEVPLEDAGKDNQSGGSTGGGGSSTTSSGSGGGSFGLLALSLLGVFGLRRKLK